MGSVATTLPGRKILSKMTSTLILLLISSMTDCGFSFQFNLVPRFKNDHQATLQENNDNENFPVTKFRLNAKKSFVSKNEPKLKEMDVAAQIRNLQKHYLADGLNKEFDDLPKPETFKPEENLDKTIGVTSRIAEEKLKEKVATNKATQPARDAQKQPGQFFRKFDDAVDGEYVEDDPGVQLPQFRRAPQANKVAVPEDKLVNSEMPTAFLDRGRKLKTSPVADQRRKIFEEYASADLQYPTDSYREDVRQQVRTKQQQLLRDQRVEDVQYQTISDSQKKRRPEAQYQRRPDAQHQRNLSPDPQYQRRPDSQYEGRHNTQYNGRPDAQYQRRPDAQYQRRPDPQHQRRPDAQFRFQKPLIGYDPIHEDGDNFDLPKYQIINPQRKARLQALRREQERLAALEHQQEARRHQAALARHLKDQRYHQRLLQTGPKAPGVDEVLRGEAEVISRQLQFSGQQPARGAPLVPGLQQFNQHKQALLAVEQQHTAAVNRQYPQQSYLTLYG